MVYLCPDCTTFFVLEEIEDYNVYALQCPTCNFSFCSKCDAHPHFPCFCQDLIAWQNKGLETDFYQNLLIKDCVNSFTYYENVKAWASSRQDAFFDGPIEVINQAKVRGVFLAIDELSRLCDFMGWLMVHQCFNPILLTSLYNRLIVLRRYFVDLVNVIPDPFIEVSGWGNVKSTRLEAIITLNATLVSLVTARRTIRRLANPQETDEEADVLDELDNMHRVRNSWAALHTRAT